MSEHFLQIRKSSIYIKKLGHGEPIVFLHGGPGGEHGFFLPHIEQLSNHNELIFYDQKGCGKSSALEDSTHYSMNEEVLTLEELRGKLGIKKLTLFGESWGSMLALLYATAYPENVHKIILTAAVGASSEGYTVFGNELQNRLSTEDKLKIEQLSKQFQAGEIELKEIFNILDPYYVYSQEVLHKKTKTKSNPVVNSVIGGDISRNYDIRQQLNRITHVPILVIQGDHDLITPQALDELLMTFIPQATLKIIENCGHWTVVEKPEEVMEAVRNFV
ncbi:alpha/beta fold hydrolase [Bacillus sp. BGMRC 2118]|nr:alpha/beta fold hydrolase [Bacillus sp. BGMRC 2118]